MKYIRSFNEKRQDRIKIEDNMVVCVSLPKEYNGDQTVGFIPDELIPDVDDSNSYGFTTTIDDIDEKDSEKFIKPHKNELNKLNESIEHELTLDEFKDIMSDVTDICYSYEFVELSDEYDKYYELQINLGFKDTYFSEDRNVGLGHVDDPTSTSEEGINAHISEIENRIVRTDQYISHLEDEISNFRRFKEILKEISHTIDRIRKYPNCQDVLLSHDDNGMGGNVYLIVHLNSDFSEMDN